MAQISQAAGPEASNLKLLARGKKVFQQNCVSCHGDTGEGNGPAAQVINPKPRNLLRDPFKFGDAPEKIFKTITKGIEGTAMPSWKDLPRRDRWAVAYYVNQLTKSAPKK